MTRKNPPQLPSNTPPSRLRRVATETTNYAILHPTIIPSVYHFSPCSGSLAQISIIQWSLTFRGGKKITKLSFSGESEQKRAWEDRGWGMTGVKTAATVAFVE